MSNAYICKPINSNDDVAEQNSLDALTSLDFEVSVGESISKGCFRISSKSSYTR